MHIHVRAREAQATTTKAGGFVPVLSKSVCRTQKGPGTPLRVEQINVGEKQTMAILKPQVSSGRVLHNRTSVRNHSTTSVQVLRRNLLVTHKRTHGSGVRKKRCNVSRIQGVLAPAAEGALRHEISRTPETLSHQIDAWFFGVCSLMASS